MPLTPEEVVNKRFSQTQFRAGYDQDEVDDFLDEVVVELRRLIQENEELRAGIAPQASASDDAAATPAAAAPAAPEPAPAPVAEETAAVEVVEPPAPEPVAAPAFASTGGTEDDASNTTSLLQLARRLHDEHVKEGSDKRAALIEEGQATAARLVAEAENRQRTELAKLNQEKAVIEHKIDDLRSFEKEYRQKLRGYIEGQLHDLDSSAGDETAAAPSGSGFQGFGS